MNGTANEHPRDRLSPYLDDELQVDERAAVDRHLAECPDCRGELEGLRLMASAFASEPVPEMAEDLEVRVLHGLDLATVVSLRRRSFFVPASIAATIAAVGLVGVIAWKQGGLAPPPTSEPAQERESATSSKQRPMPNAAPPPVVNDKLERSRTNGIATNAPSAPTPAPGTVEFDASAPAAPKELEKKSEPERKDDAAAARLQSLGYAGASGDAEAKLKAKDATVSPSARDERAMSRAAAKPSSPAVAGALGGAVGPRCERGTIDASGEATWSLVDLPRGLDELQTVLGAVGGRLEAFEPDSTGRATVVNSRERYAEWVRAARIQGVTGLADEFPDGAGDCVRQQIRIERPQQP